MAINKLSELSEEELIRRLEELPLSRQQEIMKACNIKNDKDFAVKSKNIQKSIEPFTPFHDNVHTEDNHPQNPTPVSP
ncbi:hypothetical protein Psal006b_00492 [Piscirickettsia salmonis]|uniref:Uncharacterized protein n=1 Tax=Piscirickettsia salmonis TaxID=1238 RepID=A0A1L6TEH9_PISSA|nr:hypothetical protein [Piscirickettsia salmonis]ALB23866.1 hypothetical protein KU39_2690 [Piscirickettsia salmonis]ALT18674.1 hypothetical protein PSLF89_07510 [Piscirickettsia salmonis LF-89 = ATCC VR-1361]ALY03704.1 hypothetical protein AWE47_13245 [Piscirickettsia salmonis]AMA43267.1 hypothetical protein AWJ11_13470 [Piscirickettsia salmonis]AOS35737.1 hypothetical protein AVM72_10590 [Piscirickettsia salmonis]